MLVALTGGTGGAKLIEGLCAELPPDQLTIVCNTADDVVIHGLHVSPDIDTVLYTLAGLVDERKGWGVRGDTFHCLAQLERYACETWFKLGDRDLATHVLRTHRLRDGLSLSAVTLEFCRRLGIAAAILPMSDVPVATRVETAEGELAFQEYFVKRRCEPEVRAVSYLGIERSRPAPGVLEAIGAATGIVVCPSNPVTSIGPILAVPGMRDALRKTKARRLAVSPLIGGAAITGPAHRLMAASGIEPSASGLAEAYADFLDAIVIDHADAAELPRIAAAGVRGVLSDIRMPSADARRRLAGEVLALLRE